MSHIHVCLVSDQAIPNLTTALQFRPDTLMLLYTNGMVAQKNRLKEVLKRNQIKTEERLIEAFDLANVIQVCESVMTDYPDDEVTLNVTGGTKISAFAAFQVFYTADKKIYYVNTTGQEIQQLSPQQATEPITAKIDIRDYLAVYGFNITRWQEDETAIQKRRPITKYLAELAASKEWLIGELNRSVPDTNNLKLPCIIKLPVKPEIDKLAELLEQQGLAKRTGVGISVATLEIANFLKGFWFEEYVYTTALGISDVEVKLNVEVTWDSKAKKKVKNEFDVMIAKGTKLALISCKTANPNRIKDKDEEGIGKEYLYELDSLSDTALGLFGKKMLASARPITNEHVKSRAKSMGMDVVDGKNILTLKDKLQSWLN